MSQSAPRRAVHAPRRLCTALYRAARMCVCMRAQGDLSLSASPRLPLQNGRLTQSLTRFSTFHLSSASTSTSFRPRFCARRPGVCSFLPGVVFPSLFARGLLGYSTAPGVLLPRSRPLFRSVPIRSHRLAPNETKPAPNFPSAGRTASLLLCLSLRRRTSEKKKVCYSVTCKDIP